MQRSARTRLSPGLVSVGGITCALAAGIAFGQAAPGIYIGAQVYTQLPTTTLGGGGVYNQSAGSNNPILQNSYSLPPYGHADSVVAFDPIANGLFSASASSSINVLSVYNGTLSVAGQTSGGTADADQGWLRWFGQIFFRDKWICLSD